MGTIEYRERCISRLTLGTVQIGLPYGLRDNVGPTDENEAMVLLDETARLGINWLDTAAGYGTSETVIGNWIQRNCNNRMEICTKIAGFDHTSYAALEKSIREQTEACCKRLNVDALSMLMFHNADEYLGDMERMNHVMSKMKMSGEIALAGVSVYPYHDMDLVAASGLDAVQLPLNALDHRLTRSGIMRKMRDRGMTIFARSVFLQGLLLRSPDRLPDKMKFSAETVDRYRRLCDTMGKAPKQLAFDYVLSLQDVSSIVIGCRSKEQLDDCWNIYTHSKSLTEKEMHYISDYFSHIPEKVITPSYW